MKKDKNLPSLTAIGRDSLTNSSHVRAVSRKMAAVQAEMDEQLVERFAQFIERRCPEIVLARLSKGYNEALADPRRRLTPPRAAWRFNANADDRPASD